MLGLAQGRYSNKKNSSLANTQLRPFTSTSKNIRTSTNSSSPEEDEIEKQLERIEARLERGSMNHLMAMNEKAMAVKNNNEVVDKTNHDFKKLLKNQEEKTLHMYVQNYYNKHKKVKEVREVLQMDKQSQSNYILF